MFSAAHIYELPLSTDTLATFAQTAAGIEYLNSQCKIDYKDVERHQEFMQAVIDGVDDQNLDEDLMSIALGLEEDGSPVELDPVVVNDQIRLMEELETYNVGWGNPFSDLRDILIERGGQPKEAVE